MMFGPGSKLSQKKENEKIATGQVLMFVQLDTALIKDATSE